MKQTHRHLFELKLPKSWTSHLTFILIVLFCTGIVYLPIFHNQLVMDDVDFIVNWPQLRNPSANLEYLLRGGLPEGQAGVYRPIRSLIQAASFQLFGTQLWGYHLISLSIHLWITTLAYWLSWRLTKQKITAFLTGLFFGIHPVHVEAVTWISSSFDMAGIGFLLTSLVIYLDPKTRTSKQLKYLTILFVTLAYFTYEATLVLPLLITSYKLFIKRQSINQVARLTRWFWTLAIIYWLVRSSLDIPLREVFILNNSYWTSGLVMSVAIIKYLGLVLWPQTLSFNHEIINGITNTFIHDHATSQMISYPTLTTPGVVISLGLILCVSLYAWHFRRRNPVILFGWFWFLVCLLPVLQIIPTGKLFAERYVYMASFGPLLILAHAASRLLQLRAKLIVLGILVGLSGFYSYHAFTYNQVWRTPLTFWTYQLTKSPESALIHNELAATYSSLGQHTQALQHIEAAAALNPESAEYINNLALTRAETQRWDEAVALAHKALELEPDYFPAFLNLGNFHQQQGEYSEALGYYQVALTLNPQSMDALINAGFATASLNQADQAQALLLQAMTLHDHRIEPHLALVQFYLAQSHSARALEHLNQARLINPKHPQLIELSTRF